MIEIPTNATTTTKQQPHTTPQHGHNMVGGEALEDGEIVGILKKLKDGMPADLADSLKADEEEGKTNHAPLVAAKENEIATLTATIEMNLWQGDLAVEVDSVKGDLAETEKSLEGDEASSEWEERQKSRVESPQLMRRFLWSCDSTGRRAHRRGCGWLATVQALAQVDVPTAPHYFVVRTKESNTCVQVFFPRESLDMYSKEKEKEKEKEKGRRKKEKEMEKEKEKGKAKDQCKSVTVVIRCGPNFRIR